MKILCINSLKENNFYMYSEEFDLAEIFSAIHLEMFLVPNSLQNFFFLQEYFLQSLHEFSRKSFIRAHFFGL